MVLKYLKTPDLVVKIVEYESCLLRGHHDDGAKEGTFVIQSPIGEDGKYRFSLDLEKMGRMGRRRRM